MSKEIDKEILKTLAEKGLNTESFLEGLKSFKPLTYWDYIQTESLLNLQIQRSDLPDEMVFIVYHQINELLFKMILWELEQLANKKQLIAVFFSERLERISRYFDMLCSSFKIMKDGMELEQYMKFRKTLAPASGFQSAQYRKIEFACTELINLIDFRFRKTINRNTPFKHAFEHLYWQAAGKNHKTGEKSIMIKLFEEKYMEDFIDFMKKYNNKNIWSLFDNLPDKEKNNIDLVNSMRHLDHTVNIKWVMQHFNTASKYLDGANKVEKATGGSDWKKYMHPKYQRRTFFPKLWSVTELDNWGEQNLEGHEILSNFNDLKI
ncbi:MAG: tryptophan 2,3-dioxygenase family protein [Flavobacteriales bacterium]|nr:tryptophan 2,3-dioxygenase family protein [Flavobacteriales bacterium]MDG1798322.1 tryptophan 2,3-dioxygenase family protein [Flavobacteriales bacterium]